MKSIIQLICILILFFNSYGCKNNYDAVMDVELKKDNSGNKINEKLLKYCNSWEWPISSKEYRLKHPLSLTICDNKEIYAIHADRRLLQFIPNKKAKTITIKNITNMELWDISQKDKSNYFVIVKDENRKGHVALLDRKTYTLSIINIPYNIRLARWVPARSELWYTAEKQELYIFKNNESKSTTEYDVRDLFTNNKIIAGDIRHISIIISGVNNIAWTVLKKNQWWKTCNNCTNRLRGINFKNELIFHQQYTSLVQLEESKDFQIAGTDNIYLYRVDGKSVDLLSGNSSVVYVEGKYLLNFRNNLDTYILDLYEFND